VAMNHQWSATLQPLDRLFEDAPASAEATRTVPNRSGVPA